MNDRNKMAAQQLSPIFGPILMIHYDISQESIDFQPPIKVLQYLLETWPAKSGNSISIQSKMHLCNSTYIIWKQVYSQQFINVEFVFK